MGINIPWSKEADGILEAGSLMFNLQVLMLLRYKPIPHQEAISNSQHDQYCIKPPKAVLFCC